MKDAAHERRDADRAEHRGEREQHRQPRGDERAEGEQQDHERQRHRQLLGAREVSADRVVHGAIRAGLAELATGTRDALAATTRRRRAPAPHGRPRSRFALSGRLRLGLIAHPSAPPGRAPSPRGAARGRPSPFGLHGGMPGSGLRRARLHEHALADRVLDARIREDLLRTRGLSVALLGIRQLPRPDSEPAARRSRRARASRRLPSSSAPRSSVRRGPRCCGCCVS